MLIQIVEGFWCDPEKVSAVKATGEDACALFLDGQSAMDGGFHLEHDAEKIADALNRAWDGEDDSEDEDEEPGNKEDDGEQE